MAAVVLWLVFILHLLVAHAQNLSLCPSEISVLHATSTLCGDLELPCSLPSNVSLNGLQVRWTLPPSNTLVHLYKNGKDELKDQSLEYRGRTKLITDNRANGQIILKIYKVTESNQGRYMCRIHSDAIAAGTDVIVMITPPIPCTMQRTIEALKEANKELTAKVELLEKEQGWVKGRHFEVNVTLDPDTAHPQLIISADRRSVKFATTPKNVTDGPRRFANHPCVLGSESYSRNSYTWEVDVGDSGEWSVGMVPESADLKTDRMMTPEKRFWAVYMVENPDPSISPRPRRVGLFLHGLAKLLYIYNADTMDLIYAFVTNDEELFPLFCVFGSAELKL